MPTHSLVIAAEPAVCFDPNQIPVTLLAFHRYAGKSQERAG